MASPILEKYLGDGLYADFSSYDVRLHAERDGATHEVFAEPTAVAELLRGLHEVHGTDWMKGFIEGVFPWARGKID